MKTLRELVNKQQFNMKDDLEVIEQWFVENDEEMLGIKMVSRLAKSQYDKVKNKFDYAKTWMPYMHDYTKIFKDKTVGEYMNMISKIHLLDCELSGQLLDWAKENIPTLTLPNLIFLPMVKWLAEKYDIKFKDYDEKMQNFLNCGIGGW